MKKILLFLFICTGFSTFSQSNWIKGHAVWHYDHFNFLETGALRIETIGDTIVQGHTCQKLKCDSHIITTTGRVINTEYKFIYFEQDTVWYLKNDVFFVLYDFTAVQGQVKQLLELPDFGTPMECNDNSYIFIDSVYPGFLNGQSAMFYETRDSSLNAIRHGGLVNSRFGMMSIDFAASHLFPGYGWCDQDPEQGPLSYEGAIYKLRCFQDDSLTYNPGNVDCDYYTYLGLDQLSTEKTTIYPNPTSGKLNVVSDVPVSKVEVFDSYGKRCLSKSPGLTLTELDLSGLNSGIYLIQITTNTDQVIIKKVQRN